MGYEQAGTFCYWELPLDSIGSSVGKSSAKEIRSLPMQPVVPVRQEIFHELHRQWAIANNGNILDVPDDVLLENNGKFALSVSGELTTCTSTS